MTSSAIPSRLHTIVFAVEFSGNISFYLCYHFPSPKMCFSSCIHVFLTKYTNSTPLRAAQTPFPTFSSRLPHHFRHSSFTSNTFYFLIFTFIFSLYKTPPLYTPSNPYPLYYTSKFIKLFSSFSACIWFSSSCYAYSTSFPFVIHFMYLVFHLFCCYFVR